MRRDPLGLLGSRFFVSQLSAEERRGVQAMLNLDMVGGGDAWRFGGTDALTRAALRVAADLGFPAGRLGGSLLDASDHASFLAAGIPAVFVYRTDDPAYHTAGDRPEQVDPVALDQAGQIVLRLLETLAGQ